MWCVIVVFPGHAHLFILLVKQSESVDCCVSVFGLCLFHVVSWYVVCNCGISWSYLFVLVNIEHPGIVSFRQTLLLKEHSST